MNEQIQELIKQAGGIGYDDDGNKLTPALVGKGLEKFAELIAKECIKICDSQSVGSVGTHPSAHNSAIAKCMLKIKEHFGVE
jgi:hypothetical protein